MSTKKQPSQPESVECANCKIQFDLKPNIKVIEVGRVNNRIYSEVGIECPGCKHWHRSFFTTDKLEKRKRKLTKLRKSRGKSPGGNERFLAEQARVKEYTLKVQTEAARLFGQ